MTLRMYAERKGLALKSVEVRLSHARLHAEDCLDCETKEGMLVEIQSEIHLEGDLKEAEQKVEVLLANSEDADPVPFEAPTDEE